MKPKYISFITRLRCPECGNALFSSGSEVWCSRQGSAEQLGCQYGVVAIVTVRDHLDRIKREYIEAEVESQRQTLTRF